MKLQLPHHQNSAAIESIVKFMAKEIDVDLSEMQAESILDYFTKELAPFAYNKGIDDAQKFMLLKTEDLAGTCFEEGLTYWSKSKSTASARRKPSL